jgi:sodium borate transporter 11
LNSLSLLFFMDQNISAAMVDSPDNKLVKGNAYHWDLLVVGLINGLLCIFGLPFMHAVLPHSPLHVKCLADTEEHVESGYVKNIVVYVRETRLTNLFSNILIGIPISLDQFRILQKCFYKFS